MELCLEYSIQIFDLLLDIVIMVLPEKFSTLKVDELRAECDLRKIPHTGLPKEQMKTQIIEYEEDLARQPKEENVNEESGEESEIKKKKEVIKNLNQINCHCVS